MRAVLGAVAAAPPKRFAGGGYWEAMKGEMVGWFEVRVDGPGRRHYRLFCKLDYNAEGVEKPLLVVIDGREKPFRTELAEREYRAVRKLVRSTAPGIPAASPEPAIYRAADASDLPLRVATRCSASALGSATRP